MIFFEWLATVLGIILLLTLITIIILIIAKKFGKILLNPVFITFALLISSVLFCVMILILGVFTLCN